MEICYLNPNSFIESKQYGYSNRIWDTAAFEGEWVHGVSAGGRKECRGEPINKTFTNFLYSMFFFRYILDQSTIQNYYKKTG